MKETDFSTKNRRSVNKIAQLKQLLKSNDSTTFVVEMYIYCTKKYFVKLHKRYVFMPSSYIINDITRDKSEGCCCDVAMFSGSKKQNTMFWDKLAMGIYVPIAV